jgi:hypothetical protein
MVMDFSLGWVKPSSVMTIEQLAKAKLELARTAMLQATHRPIAGNPLVLERPQPGLQQRLLLLAACPP